MKRLILMRHAKSDWANPSLSDHDRPLNKRGRGAAPKMADWLRGLGVLPDLALVSTAVRTQETWARMEIEAPKIDLARLYHAEPETILSAVQEADETAQTILILGHQPGMQEAANRFLPEWEIDEFPTAKIAVIDFDAPSWFEIVWGEGRLLHHAAPKELP